MECVKPTITEREKATPSFLCTGHMADGRFVPCGCYINTETLESQKAVQVFIEAHGANRDHTD